jgi:thymidylate synthase (FAD)
MKIVEPSVTLIRATADPLRLIERCGRACYQSTHKTLNCGDCMGEGCVECHDTGTSIISAIAFVKMVIERGHYSVLEHASATFSVITDRGVTHEIVRHRVGVAYSQESTRYCDYNNERFGDDICFIEPPGLSDEHTEDAYSGAPWPSTREMWKMSMAAAESAYKQLRQSSVPPEIARSVLPNALKSEIVMTFDFQAWRHFLKLRTSPKAHPQMRQVANLIREQLMKIAPECFEDLS